MEEKLLISLLIEYWIVSFIITALVSYMLLRTLFKLSTIQKNKFIVTYIIAIIILDTFLILNKETVSPQLFKGLSMGLFMGMFFAVVSKKKNDD
jgi:hypothetical protein